MIIVVEPLPVLCFHSVLTAVVAEDTYQVEEAVGFVPVCVDISGGALARSVTLQVMTQDGTAQGTK